MYELLLQWGLESLTKLTMAKDSKDVSIMVEAIKTKNALVIERFRYAWTASQAVVDLAIEVENALSEFQIDAKQTDGTRESALRYLGQLQGEFHPRYYRQLNKIRSQFESTNDILSAYSVLLTDLVHIGTVRKIVDKKKNYKRNYLARTYRGLWTLYADIMTSLIRVTSNDLRFWLTDKPYIIQADEWAEKEVKIVNQFLLADDWGGKRFHLILETPDGLEKFWKTVL